METPISLWRLSVTALQLHGVFQLLVLRTGSRSPHESEVVPLDLAMVRNPVCLKTGGHPKFITLPETNSSGLKMDGWKMIRLPFGTAYFQGRTVSYREGR